MVPASPAPSRSIGLRASLGRRKSAANASALARQGAHGREALALGRAESTLGSIFAKSLSPGVAMFAVGSLDAHGASRWLEERTGGVLNASRALAVAGAISRGADLDGKVPLIGHYVRRANTAMLTGFIPTQLYLFGQQAGTSLFGGRPKNAQKVNASAHAEPVPGEASAA